MLLAMKRGHYVTIMNGPTLCGSTAIPQRFQELRDEPGVTEDIVSERVPGKRYHRYYIPGALNNATKETNTVITVSAHTRKAPVKCEHTMELFA